MNDEIRDHLTSKAEGMNVEVPDQPKQRPRSQAPLAAAAAAMAMVLAVGITVPLVSGGDEPADSDLLQITNSDGDQSSSSESQAATIAPRPVPSSVSPEAVAAGDGPTLNWQAGTFPEGFVHGATAFDGGFLAWGTEALPPEEAIFTQTFALWFSSDGLSWEQVDSSGFAIGENEWVAQVIGLDSGGLLAVGTAYDPPEGVSESESFGPGNERTVLWSSADGRGWQRTEFENGLPASDTPGEMWFGGQPFVAASGGRVVMVQSYMLEFDPYSLVEEELFGLGITFHGLGMTEEGIEVYTGDEAEELIEVFSYEELGLDPALFREGPGRSETRTFALVSDDGGSSWTRTDTTGFEDLGYLNGVVGTSNGFLAVGDTQFDENAPSFGPATWTSADGINWTKMADVGSYVYNLAAYGDLIVAPGDQLLLSRDGGGTWNTLTGAAFDDVDGLRFNMDQASIGPFGIVASGSAYSQGPPPPDLVIEKDGRIYRETYDDNYEQTVTVTDAASGEILLSVSNFYSPEWIVENNESFTVLDPETGEEVITIGYREFEMGFGDGFDESGVTVEVDGLIFTENHEEDRITVTNAETGEVVVDIPNARQPAHMRRDDNGFTLLDPATGEELMSILYSDMDAAYESQYAEEVYEQPVMAVWYSQDGTAWSRQDMREAFGDSGYLSGLVSGNDRVVAVFMPEPDFYPETEEEALAFVPPPSQVWVGTLGG